MSRTLLSLALLSVGCMAHLQPVIPTGALRGRGLAAQGALDGDRHFSVHAAQATFTLASASFVRGAVTNQERASVFRVTVPVGVLYEPGANKVAFTAGLTFGFLLPL